MFDPAQAKKENDRINALLAKEPQYAKIVEFADGMRLTQFAIDCRIEQIKALQEFNRKDQETLDGYKSDIKRELIELEANTGFTKAPGIAHLMTVPEKYEIKDANAVPKEYIVTKMTSSIDKVKLNKAIKSGEVDVKSNWLETVPAYKTVVIE